MAGGLCAWIGADTASDQERWPSVSGGRPLSGYFKQRYVSTEAGKRGGIMIEKTELHAPMNSSGTQRT
ncbi:MAG: hypothetical protein GY789_10600 [Hyphomicrobiales bacterium]|nr:hypothetical protein [Hyphomicrobiales bacterium]MCP4999928.1 hypothetical protein [Hyphomicrobiales bacterium]